MLYGLFCFFLSQRFCFLLSMSVQNGIVLLETTTCLRAFLVASALPDCDAALLFFNEILIAKIHEME